MSKDEYTSRRTSEYQDSSSSDEDSCEDSGESSCEDSSESSREDNVKECCKEGKCQACTKEEAYQRQLYSLGSKIMSQFQKELPKVRKTGKVNGKMFRLLNGKAKRAQKEKPEKKNEETKKGKERKSRKKQKTQEENGKDEKKEDDLYAPDFCEALEPSRQKLIKILEDKGLSNLQKRGVINLMMTIEEKENMKDGTYIINVDGKELNTDQVSDYIDEWRKEIEHKVYCWDKKTKRGCKKKGHWEYNCSKRK